jgi:hypothetical protein
MRDHQTPENRLKSLTMGGYIIWIYYGDNQANVSHLGSIVAGVAHDTNNLGTYSSS